MLYGLEEVKVRIIQQHSKARERGVIIVEDKIKKIIADLDVVFNKQTLGDIPAIQEELKKLMEEDKNTIRLVWSIDDIKGIDAEREDQTIEPLTDEECRKVLQEVERHHDAEVGVNWEVLEYWVDEVRTERI